MQQEALAEAAALCIMIKLAQAAAVAVVCFRVLQVPAAGQEIMEMVIIAQAALGRLLEMQEAQAELQIMVAIGDMAAEAAVAGEQQVVHLPVLPAALAEQP